MITAYYNFNEQFPLECDNCKRKTPLTIEYFIEAGYEHVLCEDCSCALSRLHFLCMEKGKNYIYHNDEFKEMLPSDSFMR